MSNRGREIDFLRCTRRKRSFMSAHRDSDRDRNRDTAVTSAAVAGAFPVHRGINKPSFLGHPLVHYVGRARNCFDITPRDKISLSWPLMTTISFIERLRAILKHDSWHCSVPCLLLRAEMNSSHAARSKQTRHRHLLFNSLSLSLSRVSALSLSLL